MLNINDFVMSFFENRTQFGKQLILNFVLNT